MEGRGDPGDGQTRSVLAVGGRQTSLQKGNGDPMLQEREDKVSPQDTNR